MALIFPKTLFALAALAWAASAAAQGTEEEELALIYGDNSTVSIATGASQPLRRAPAVASVITAEDIAAIGATTLAEVLETVPGMHVSRASIRYTPLFVIRGIGGGGQTNPQVLMLQNGIPVTTMYNGDRGSAWTGVPLENVARIEVIRGPGSALYGADAYAGVINVITRTAGDAPGTTAGVRAGSFDTQDAWVRHGGKWGAADVAAYLRVGSTDGIKETIGTKTVPAPGPLNTGYDAVDGSLNLSLDKWRFRANYKLRDRLQTGAGISSALDPDSFGRAEEVAGDLSWTDPAFARDWAVGASAAYLYYAFTYPTNVVLLPPSVKPPDGLIGGPNQWERQLRLSGNATYTGFAGHSLRLGLGHDDLDLYKAKTYKNYIFVAGVPTVVGPVADYSDTDPHIRPHQRRVDYLYAQDEWRFARDWTLTAGLRRDNYSDFGGTTNPRLALVWEAAYDLTAKLLYGRAFRAPSFNELYGNNPVANGDPGLRPETINTLEAALSWQARKDTQVNLSLFSYQAKNMIRLVGTSWANAAAQHGGGMELEAVWDASRNLRLTGNYSYQKSIDEATGQDAGYAPRHHGYLRADWRFSPDWSAHGQLNWVADRARAPGDARPPVPDYRTMDVTLRTAAKKPDRWDIAVSVRNLFDAQVLEPSLFPVQIPGDLPQAGRSAWVQLSHGL
ncbi:MAG: TonB-dependent receptor [Sulfuricella sp.]|nr:TonB-dependent receptor [Sulfuricella sp.]